MSLTYRIHDSSMRRGKNSPSKTPPPITVNNQLTTIPDDARAAELFRRILRAVRRERERRLQREANAHDGSGPVS
jgi:hypothetical protein